jgi:hypothetical protein
MKLVWFIACFVLAASAGFASAEVNEERLTRGLVIHGLLQEEEFVTQRATAWDAEDAPLLASAAGGLGGWFIPELYFWFPTLKGQIWTDPAYKVDLDGDLGLDDNQVSVLPQLQLSVWRIGVRFAGYRASFSGLGTIPGPFEFGGVQFVPGETVASELSIDNYKLTLLFAIVKFDFLAVWAEAGVSYYGIDSTIDGQISGPAYESADLPIPVVGVLAQAAVGKFLFELEVDGLSVTVSDVDVDLLEIQASIGYTFLKLFAVQVGYRYTSLAGTDGNLALDTTLDGFFVGASFRF